MYPELSFSLIYVKSVPKKLNLANMGNNTAAQFTYQKMGGQTPFGAVRTLITGVWIQKGYSFLYRL